jgi:hypothetical protein
VLFVVVVPLALVLLPVALGYDSIRGARFRRQQPLARVLLFFVAYLAAEMAAIWVFGLGGYLAGLALGCLGPTSRRWREWCYTHQHWWGHYLLTAAALRLLGCRQHLEGGDLVTPGSTYIALIRHNSFADTLLPQAPAPLCLSFSSSSCPSCPSSLFSRLSLSLTQLCVSCLTCAHKPGRVRAVPFLRSIPNALRCQEVTPVGRRAGRHGQQVWASSAYLLGSSGGDDDDDDDGNDQLI